MRGEWAEAEVAQLQCEGCQLELRFAAVRVVADPAGQPFALAWVPVLLTAQLTRALTAAEQAALVGRVRDGVLHHGGQRHRNFALPSVWRGPWTLALEGAYGDCVLLQGDRLALAVPEGACAVGAYQC